MFMGKGIHRLEMQVTNLSFGKEQGKVEALHGFNDMCNFLSLISPLFSLFFSIIFFSFTCILVSFYIPSLYLASSFGRGGLAQLQGCTDNNMSLTVRLMMMIIFVLLLLWIWAAMPCAFHLELDYITLNFKLKSYCRYSSSRNIC